MPSYSKPFQLSGSGSTRATAYSWGNKSVTRDGKTHVVWLDAVSDVRSRTYDHASDSWSATYEHGEGCDNHANPTITMDRHGHIRMLWGPHGEGWNSGQMIWAISTNPNNVETFKWHKNVGYGATAGAIVNTPSDMDAIVSRGGERPKGTVFHREREKGNFTTAKLLMYQDIEPQYTHHYGHIISHTDGTLYAACHFYNTGGGDNHPVQGDKSRMSARGMGMLKSIDRGDHWTSVADEPIETPAQYQHAYAIPPLDADLRVWAIDVDADGHPWALVGAQNHTDHTLLLHKWTGSEWQTRDINALLPGDLTGVDGQLCHDTAGHVHLAIAAIRYEDVGDGGAWAHPSSEIFHMQSTGLHDAFSFECVSAPHHEVANWLPALSKPGPFHPVDKPMLLYTHGEPGTGCSPDTKTDVFAVLITP